MSFSRVLVTGATGLVGSHVVDNLLGRGIKVRAVARSKQKADAMLAARPDHESRLEFYFIEDLASPGAFERAVEGVDGVIHIASTFEADDDPLSCWKKPYKYNFADNEKQLIIPAIQGVRSVMEASVGTGVRRIVLTSSFASVLDMGREESAPWVYTAKDWNPITYKEAAAPTATPQDAYRGSKTFAEQEAWNFMSNKASEIHFDLVTLCPSMIFGPLASTPSSLQDLNESNMVLWKMAKGGDEGSSALAPCRFNFWIDVRDLAEVHVQALLTPEAGGKRYIPVAPEPFTYQMAAEVMTEAFPALRDNVPCGSQGVKNHLKVDLRPMDEDFPTVNYRSFRETVVDLIGQLSDADLL